MANHETNWILRFIDQITKPLQTPTKATKELSDTVDKVTASLDTMDDATREVAKSSLKSHKDLTEGIAREEKQLVNLKKRLEDAGDALDPLQKGVIDFDIKQAETKIRRYKEQLVEVEAELDDLAKKPDPAPIKNNFTEIFGDLKNSISGIFDDLQSGNIGGLEATFEVIQTGLKGITRAAWAFITTPIGIAIAALAGIGLVTADFVKYNEAAREANIITHQITQISGEALSDARIRGQVIADTFGQDFERTLEIAKNNVQAFGVSWNEAFDNIQDGLIRGGMANDEYYDSLREYPRLFANAGFTMKEFQRTVNTGIDLGMYADKLPDAIKEFGISITEQTDSAKIALENAFGKKFTDNIFKNITNGSITAKDALQLIAEETERVGVNSKDAAVLTADLFRGAGEDAGGFTNIIDAMNAVLNETPDALSDIETHLDQVADANLRLAEAKREALESDSYIAFAQQMESFWTEIKIGYYNFITFLREWFDTVTKFYAQLLGVIVVVPKTIKETFLNVMEDLGHLVQTFLSAGEIIDDALHFRWDDARKGFANFNKDLKEDLLNLGKDLIIQPGVDLANAFHDTGKNIDMGREIAAYYGKQTSLDEPQGPKEGDTKIVDGVKYIFKNGQWVPVKVDKSTGTGLGDRESSLNGNGRGGAITMTLNVTNNFNVKNGEDIMSKSEQIIDMVVSGINSRVKDGLIAATA
jgi:hypothetical protein